MAAAAGAGEDLGEIGGEGSNLARDEKEEEEEAGTRVRTWIGSGPGRNRDLWDPLMGED